MPHSPVIKELYAEARRAGSADFYRRSKRDHLVVGASSEQFRQEPISTQMPRSGVVETYISRLPNLRPKEKPICTASAPMGPNWGGELRRVLVSSQ